MNGHMMDAHHWILGMHWGGWLFAILLVVLILLVIQRTGSTHSR